MLKKIEMPHFDGKWQLAGELTQVGLKHRELLARETWRQLQKAGTESVTLLQHLKCFDKQPGFFLSVLQAAIVRDHSGKLQRESEAWSGFVCPAFDRADRWHGVEGAVSLDGRKDFGILGQPRATFAGRVK